MAARRPVANLMALALLALLLPDRALHPYEMAAELRRTGKDRDMPIRWGSLYTVVGNLEKHGLIEATGSRREGRRPERTEYAITAAGRSELQDWLRELVAHPEPDFPPFRAALSVLGALPPDEVEPLLAQRISALERETAGTRAELAAESVPRIFLVEAEYALALREAELAWTRSLLRELTDGTLPGLAGWREFHATGAVPAGWDEQ